ncbi:MAG: glycosyltransferase family 4 protein [Hyphomonadaceae bacterium]|nr:glycosyltransferase family 4 protein [Hyphomonadaceae bacterium]
MRICAIGLRGIPDVMGGVETHCEHLYPRLAKLDDKLEIVVVGRSGYVRSGHYGNVRVVTLWAPKHKTLEALIHTPLAILYARLFLHPDVIHLHAVGPGFFTPLARLLGFRVIGTHHSQDYKRSKWGRFGRWFLTAGEWMMARFANEVICVSSAIETSLGERFPMARQRFVTIRNGAPPASGASSAGNLLEKCGLEPGKYILCVGRLDPAKGFPDAVRAFEKARPAGMKLVIAGGALPDDVFAQELMRSATKDVMFLGARPSNEIRMLYRNAGLFLHPSHLEGFPIVVLEALAADTPILVSDIPAHREVGLDASSYFACKDVDALAARLDAGGFETLRCTRRAEILKENDWETIASRHREIIVRQSRARPPAEVRAAVH